MRRISGLNGGMTVGKPMATSGGAGYPIIHRTSYAFIQVLFLLLC
jgi:hypothetical protein